MAASQPSVFALLAPITRVIDHYGLYYEALTGLGSISKARFFGFHLAGHDFWE
jgi:hypothetical protein